MDNLTTTSPVTIGGVSLRRLNLEHEWTYRQNQIAKQLMGQLFGAMQGMNQATLTGKISPEESTELGISLLSAMLEMDIEADILALLYIGEKEGKFDIKTYPGRVELIKDANMEEVAKMESAIQDFFAIKGGSVLKGSLTYLDGLKHINQVSG